MATDGLLNPRGPCRAADLFLEAGFIDMVPADDPGARVGGEAVGGKDILPFPIQGGAWVFALQSVR